MDKKLDSINNPVYFNWYMLELDKRNKNISKESKKQKEEEYVEYYERVKQMRSRSRSKNTINKNIYEKALNCYATFTLKKEKSEIDEKLVIQSFLKMLKRYVIPYVGVKEYQENGNIHFHMFIRVDDEKLVRTKIIDEKVVKDIYGNVIYELIPFESNYGFTTLKYIDASTEYQKKKMISYVSKYIVKDGNKIMSSRYGKISMYDMAVGFFGADKVVVKK